MEYRNLGRTGVKVSSLCLGCMMFGSKTEPAESMEIIDRAIDSGINFFDTANVYGDGASEEMTGEALARNGKRNRIVLATKVHGRLAGNDPNAGGSSRRHIIETMRNFAEETPDRLDRSLSNAPTAAGHPDRRDA